MAAARAVLDEKWIGNKQRAGPAGRVCIRMRLASLTRLSRPDVVQLSRNGEMYTPYLAGDSSEVGRTMAWPPVAQTDTTTPVIDGTSITLSNIGE